MLLGEILHRSVIQPRLSARDKRGAIDELIELLIEAGDLPEPLRQTVRRVVYDREASGGTGMGEGVALPHGATDSIENIVAALGISHEGIDFESIDGQPARLIILLLIPRNEFQAYVRDLAGIAHVLDDEDFRDALIDAGDADRVLTLIRREEHSPRFFDFLDRFGWRRKRGESE